MRNEDLKNKLDQRPANFDREALWDRIEAEDNDDRRKFIWWWFGGLISIALVGLLVWNATKDSSVMGNDVAVESEMYTSRSQQLINSKEIELPIIDTDESIIEQFDTELTKVDKEEKIESIASIEVKEEDKQEAIILKKEVTVDNIANVTEVQQPNNEDQLDREIEMFADGKQMIATIEQDIVSLQSEIDKGESSPEVISDISFLGRNRKVKIIAINSLTAKNLLYDYELFSNQEFVIQEKKDNSKKSIKNKFSIGIGLGSDNHSFQKDDFYNRGQLERNLESLTLGIQYQRMINVHWSLGLAVDYTTSMTNVNYSGNMKSQYLRSIQDGNTYIVTTQTEHKLYNRYSRVNMNLELGYVFSFRKWQISPFGGVGLGIQSFVDGDVIADDNSLISLSNLDLYKDKLGTFAIGGISIERTLGSSFIVGLKSRINTLMHLTSNNNEHTIRPMGIRFSLGYVW